MLSEVGRFRETLSAIIVVAFVDLDCIIIGEGGTNLILILRSVLARVHNTKCKDHVGSEQQQLVSGECV
jgi:hypothetical protein